MSGQLLNGGPRGAQMVLAQPLNDVQLLALVAAQVPGTATERVQLALEITTEARVRIEELPEMIREKQAAKAAENPV